MRSIIIIVSLILFSSLKAQTQLQGFVQDETQTFLPFAHVGNLSTYTGTVTTDNGFFFLPAIIGDTIRISFVGYKTLFTVVTEDMLDREIKVTMVPDFVILPSVWVYSSPKYKVPMRYIGRAMKIHGVIEPSQEITKPVKFQMGISEMGAPSVGIQGALTYLTKEAKEKRMAEEAYTKTKNTITFSKLLALEKTRERLRSTFLITDSELDRLIILMNKEQPYIQSLTDEKSLISSITAYLSLSTFISKHK